MRLTVQPPRAVRACLEDWLPCSSTGFVQVLLLALLLVTLLPPLVPLLVLPLPPVLESRPSGIEYEYRLTEYGHMTFCEVWARVMKSRLDCGRRARYELPLCIKSGQPVQRWRTAS